MHDPAHLVNINMLFERLRNTQFTQNSVMESFDVTPLYTNSSNDAAMQAVCELLAEYQPSLNLYVTISKLMTNVCAVSFSMVGYYKQVRSLAMG
ncbi:unnamed protein product [Strongylus vulgaris]|uniref:Uncharacterized protein n=1 Tax=Strongylus vulgaris TaxID=40348 RepID=A0A3P7K5P4_STRVU|nr:unnamed protein product [Strongylus vulgaris]